MLPSGPTGADHFDGPPNSWRTYRGRAVAEGALLREVIRCGDRDWSATGARHGASSAPVYWPGPRAAEVLSAEDIAAWEAVRLGPPADGVVSVGGVYMRAIDGVALGTAPGGDWHLRRGGLAVRWCDGEPVTARWEVVNG